MTMRPSGRRGKRNRRSSAALVRHRHSSEMGRRAGSGLPLLGRPFGDRPAERRPRLWRHPRCNLGRAAGLPLGHWKPLHRRRGELPVCDRSEAGREADLQEGGGHGLQPETAAWLHLRRRRPGRLPAVPRKLFRRGKNHTHGSERQALWVARLRSGSCSPRAPALHGSPHLVAVDLDVEPLELGLGAFDHSVEVGAELRVDDVVGRFERCTRSGARGDQDDQHASLLHELGDGQAHASVLTDCGSYEPGGQARGSSSSATMPAAPSFSTITYPLRTPITCSISMSSWPSARRKCVPSCRTRSYSSTVNERRSKQPVVEHSQMNSNGSLPPSPLARSLMLSLSVLNSDSFFARRSCRSSSTTAAYRWIPQGRESRS